jgi:hypothetical protein
MFSENRSLKKVDARPSEIITLLVSTNRPMVALSGPAQQADAFIISVDRGKTQPVYLCFHTMGGGKRLIYTSDTVPTSESSRVKVEEEALRFAEDMGFMMVRERFDELAPKQRDDAIVGLAPFADDISNVRQDEKPDKKHKRGSATRPAESEIEYEEVYEEIEEEVPVEEEAPKPEEYESLLDVVTEISSQEAAAQAVKDTARTRRPDVRATAAETAESAGAAEEAFDLGEELSDVVETMREIPEGPRPTQKTVAVEPSPPEDAVERPGTLEPAEGESTGIVSDSRQAVIRLLISL